VRIVVVGAGVVGLTTAVELLDAGYEVAVLARDFSPFTTADRAGGIWLPLLNHDERDSPADYETRLAEWTRESWRRLVELAADPATGVRYVTNHELFREPEDPPDLIASLLPDLEATPDDRLPGGFVYRWSFTTVKLETPVYMPWLARAVRERGGTIARRSFADRSELGGLDCDAVVNCTGLAARELFGDSTLRGIKGQLLLHDPLPLADAYGAYDFGVLPRSDALVLGSLFDERYDTLEPTDEATRRIWDELSRWRRVDESALGLPRTGLELRRVRRVLAGIRPFRPQGVRLELDRVDQMPVIHDYGHGGSGLTLSWGCARDVRALVEAL
jgi:D-amino-acid oxidase